jgi:DNA-binding response OmpR family regulator
LLLGRRVLVVEDEYFIADEIRRFLIDHGANVVGPFPNMAMGLDLLAAREVDCAVLDIDLHGESVFPLAHALRAKSVPWVYVTGYHARDIPSGLEGTAYIAKPINETALIGALHGLI